MKKKKKVGENVDMFDGVTMMVTMMKRIKRTEMNEKDGEKFIEHENDEVPLGEKDQRSPFRWTSSKT